MALISSMLALTKCSSSPALIIRAPIHPPLLEMVVVLIRLDSKDGGGSRRGVAADRKVAAMQLESQEGLG